VVSDVKVDWVFPKPHYKLQIRYGVSKGLTWVWHRPFELLSAVLFLLCLTLFIINHLYWMTRCWYHKLFLLSAGLICKATMSSACMNSCLHSICDTIKKVPLPNHVSKQKFTHATTCKKGIKVVNSFYRNILAVMSYSFFFFSPTVYTKIIKGCFQLVNHSITKWTLWRNDICTFLYDMYLSYALNKWLFMEICPLFCKFI